MILITIDRILHKLHTLFCSFPFPLNDILGPFSTYPYFSLHFIILDYSSPNHSSGRDISGPTNFVCFCLRRCSHEYASLHIYVNLWECF